MEARQEIAKIRENICKVIVGKEQMADLLLTAMIAEGHVLVEDMPGTGKTLMAKSLAKSIEGEFGRIQFTPDLLPSDVTGLNIYHQKTGKFEFHRGPVFSNVLLADEINRATPRTQSALLECMEEGQVTVDGTTRKLAAPFMVIATQNPIETAGTFPLPEAQLDRFLMKVEMGMLKAEEELQMLLRYSKDNPYKELQPVCSKEMIVEARKEAADVFIHEDLLAYIQQISETTRKTREILVGVSPRGTLALLRAVKAYAYMQGRTYAVPEDVKFLAVPVLAHRLILQANGYMANAAEAEISKIIQTLRVPTEEWKR